VLTIVDIITASGRYPERLKSLDLTDDVIRNIHKLLAAVNAILKDLGMSRKVTSGFRPLAVNEEIPSAAKKSAHTEGLAADIEDVDGQLKGKILSKPYLLSQYGLWMEDSASTPTWCHLDLKDRPERLIRVFKP